MQSLFGYLTINLFYELFKIIMLCYFLKVYLHNLQLDFHRHFNIFFMLDYWLCSYTIFENQSRHLFSFSYLLEEWNESVMLKTLSLKIGRRTRFYILQYYIVRFVKIVLHIHLYSLYKNILGNSRVLFKDFTVKIFYYLPCQYQDPTAPMNSWSPV